MSLLDDLKKQRAELDKQIAKAERTQAESLKAVELAKFYVKVVCPHCNGRGVASWPSMRDNADMDERGCGDCQERGFLWARKWDGLRNHDMEHNEVTTP